MGWRGTVRSISAAIRAAEREAQRRQKAEQKQNIIENSAAAVEAWEDYNDNLVSIHTDLADAIDWWAIVEESKPIAPEFSTAHEDRAAAALAAFKPGLFDVFRGGTGKLRARLEADRAAAPAKDHAEREKALCTYRAQIDEWAADTALARQLLAGEPTAIRQVIAEMQSLSDHGLIGEQISFSIGQGSLHAIPEVHTDEVVPKFRRKQLASGRLSETKMLVGEFNELYQDHIASVALKVAGDLFRIIPIDEIYVTCLALMLNPRTGHMELTPILSVQFVRSTFSSLNLSNVDPSDAIGNFNHTMSFKRTKGFAPIDPLKPIG